MLFPAGPLKWPRLQICKVLHTHRTRAAPRHTSGPHGSLRNVKHAANTDHTWAREAHRRAELEGGKHGPHLTVMPNGGEAAQPLAGDAELEGGPHSPLTTTSLCPVSLPAREGSRPVCIPSYVTTRSRLALGCGITSKAVGQV